jgi:hypothetical protein
LYVRGQVHFSGAPKWQYCKNSVEAARLSPNFAPDLHRPAAVMALRKIKRKRGEGISISGAAIVRVSRRVTLVVEAPSEAQVMRLTRADVERSTRRVRKNRHG